MVHNFDYECKCIECLKKEKQIRNEMKEEYRSDPHATKDGYYNPNYLGKLWGWPGHKF